MLITACYLSRKGGEKTNVATLVSRNQDTEHFSQRQLLVPCGLSGDVTQNLISCHDRQLMRFITERESELLRQHYSLDAFLKMMKELSRFVTHLLHHVSITV